MNSGVKVIEKAGVNKGWGKKWRKLAKEREGHDGRGRN